MTKDLVGGFGSSIRLGFFVVPVDEGVDDRVEPYPNEPHFSSV